MNRDFNVQITCIKDLKGGRNNQIPWDGGLECPSDFDEYPNLHNREQWGFWLFLTDLII